MEFDPQISSYPLCSYPFRFRHIRHISMTTCLKRKIIIPNPEPNPEPKPEPRTRINTTRPAARPHTTNHTYCKHMAFQRRKRKFLNRKRTVESPESDEEDNVAATAKIQRKYPKADYFMKTRTGTDMTTFSGSDQWNSENKNDVDQVRPEVSGGKGGFSYNEKSSSISKVSVVFESSRTGKRDGPEDMGATSITQVDTEFDRDSQALFEKQLRANKESAGFEDDKMYKGQSGYAVYYEKKDSAKGNAASGMVR